MLLLTAAIWGFAFVAQRLGMDHVGPFTYSGVRFALGALPLAPVMLAGRRSSGGISVPMSPREFYCGRERQGAVPPGGVTL